MTFHGDMKTVAEWITKSHNREEPKHVVNMGSPAAELSQKILLEIQQSGKLESLQLSQSLNEEHQKIIGAIKSLQSLGDVSMSSAS